MGKTGFSWICAVQGFPLNCQLKCKTGDNSLRVARNSRAKLHMRLLFSPVCDKRFEAVPKKKKKKKSLGQELWQILVFRSKSKNRK